MVKLHLNIMFASIENLSHLNSNNPSSTNTIKSSGINNVDYAVPVINGSKVAKAVLICHPNSHSFLDRTLTLDKQVKIGRSVGHYKASVNNGLFDCKVLSRNHALLWYEDGKFFLKDTRSSNGTFVNTDRLSKSAEESVPREVFSGDIIQFGVDVVENSRNVTHGCVIATLKLYLPNGKEAKSLPSVFSPSDRNKATLEDLYQLNQYLQESLQREQMLETKLNALQTLIKILHDSTDLSWKALISNNSLLSRVELLEVQLKCYSNKFAENKLREELRTLQEDKNAYEGALKEYYLRILDEKLEATQQCQDLNRALDNAKKEFANNQILLSNCQNELRELALKNSLLEKTIEELEIKLQVSDEKNKEVVQKLTDENTVLFNQVKNMTKNEEILQQTIKELETHGDYAHKQVISLQNQVEELQKHHSDILCELVDPTIIKDKISDVDLITSWISIYTDALRKCKENVAIVHKRVEQLRCDKAAKQQCVTLLECKLNKCAIELQDFREEQIELEAKIVERKNELELFKPIPDILDELNEKKCSENEVQDLQEKRKLLNVIQKDINLSEERFKEVEKMLKNAKSELMELTVLHAIEEDKLDLHEKQLFSLETAVRTLNEHVEHLNSNRNEKLCVEDVQILKKQLLEAHELAQEKQSGTIIFVKNFFDFINLVNEKLNDVEKNVEQLRIVDQDICSLDELKLLKEDSFKLTEVVNELQKFNFDNLIKVGKLKNQENVDEPDCKVAEFSSSQNLLPVIAPALDVDQMKIMKEKYKLIVIEKEKLKEEYLKLKQQYDYLKSYPYFDLYFILPALILICVCMFNFGDKLSIIFGN